MKLKPILKTLLLVFVLASNIGCDQITKNIARQQLEYGEQVSVIPGHLNLIKVEPLNVLRRILSGGTEVSNNNFHRTPVLWAGRTKFTDS